MAILSNKIHVQNKTIIIIKILTALFFIDFVCIKHIIIADIIYGINMPTRNIPRTKIIFIFFSHYPSIIHLIPFAILKVASVKWFPSFSS